jgi:subtilisin family serine protease
MKKHWLLPYLMSLACVLPAMAADSSKFVRVSAEQRVAGEYLVKFKSHVRSLDAATAARNHALAYGGTILSIYEHAPIGFAIATSEASAFAISQSADVEFVQDNHSVRLLQSACGTDASGVAFWGSDRIDQRTIPRDGRYCPPRTGRGVNVYVVDSGINLHHTDFGGRTRAMYDFGRLPGDANYSADCTTGLGHGSKVAGILGGNRYGVAKEVTLWSVRVADCNGFGNARRIADGINHVTARVQRPAVMNLSVEGEPSTFLDDAARAAMNRGIIVVAGAGNAGSTISNSPQRVASILTVGAARISILDAGSNEAIESPRSDSNHGPLVDLYAPGDQLGSITNVNTTDFDGLGGTSAAAPMASGVAAMVLEANPAAVQSEVHNQIVNNATTGALTGVPFNTANRYLYSNFIAPALGTLQFSQPEYSVSEGTNSITITVTRSGGTGSASVRYTTRDRQAGIPCGRIPSGGVASDRCDIVTTTGVLHFAAGETSKTFTIFVVDDSYAEGTEALDLVLSMPQNASLGANEIAGLTIGDNETVSGPNPIRNNSYFVRMQYLDFLNREPEASGLAAWTGVLNNCPNVDADPSCDRTIVSQSFFQSPEFHAKGFFVYRFYTTSFGRRPMYLEFMADLPRVSGATAEETNARRAAFASEWVQSPEFRSIYDPLSNSEYVNTLFQRAGLTGDTITSGGTVYSRGQLTNELNAAVRTRADVLRLMVDSSDVDSKEYNGAFVTMEYFGYLRRDPDEAGFNNWMAYLASHPGDYRTMVHGFVYSSEYNSRFGPN